MNALSSLLPGQRTSEEEDPARVLGRGGDEVRLLQVLSGGEGPVAPGDDDIPVHQGVGDPVTEGLGSRLTTQYGYHGAEEQAFGVDGNDLLPGEG